MSVYGTYTDANVYLDQGKLLFNNDQEALPYMTEATRTIQAYLYGRIDAAIMDTWDAMAQPPTVPGIIRSVAGRLAAARYYFSKYSGEAEEVTPYAEMLWNQGIAVLNGILDGTIVIPEMVTVGVDIVTEQHLQEGMFYPTDDDPASGPIFTINVLL